MLRSRSAIADQDYGDVVRTAAIQGRTPMARFGKVEELQGLAVLPGSVAGRFIPGQTIAVAGGFLSNGV